MTETPQTESPRPSARTRILALLANPDASVNEILRLLREEPLWDATLLSAASEARGHPVQDLSQALLLLGFLKARHVLAAAHPLELRARLRKALAD